jgi:micrococcal nuclease
MRKLILILLIPLFSCVYRGHISRVIDGDTFIFKGTFQTFRVRMYGIDAPEISQFYGDSSKLFLKKYLYKEATLKTFGKDCYGRTIGILYVNSENINRLEVLKGYAWAYWVTNYCPDQFKAENLGLGLWKYPHIKPSLYRYK